MEENAFSTTASAITIAGAIFGLVQFLRMLLDWKRALDKLPSRLADAIKSIRLLKAVVNHVEEHVDNSKPSQCSETHELRSYLRQCRKMEGSASLFVEHAGKQASHPARYMQILNSYRILRDGELVNTESQLNFHIHQLIEKMVLPEYERNQVDEPSQPEDKQLSLQSVSAMMKHNTSNQRVIEHIPILPRLGTFEGRHQRQNISTLILHPRWLPSRGFKLGFHRSASGNISPSLRPYIIQSPDCEIFSAVAGGDLEKTLRLFGNGQSTPFVRDKNGCSLLHHASCSSNLLLCQTLIDLGLRDNVDEETPHGLTPGHLALLNGVWDPSKDRTSVNHLVSMLMRYSSNPDYATSLKIFLVGCCAGSPDIGKLNCLQNIAAPGLFKAPKTDLLAIAKIYILASHSQRHPRPDVFKFLIGLSREDKLVEALESTQGRGCLLHILAIGLIRYHRELRPTFAGLPTSEEFNKHSETWKNMCCAITRTSRQEELYHTENFKLDDVMKGYSRTRPTEWTGSPLISVLQALFLDDFTAPSCQPCSNYGRPQHWYHSLSSTVNIWLEQIVAAEVDLEHYGERESKLLAAQRFINIGCLDFTIRSSSWSSNHRAFIEDSLPIRLMDFKYGALVREWRVCWEIDVEKLVGEFWHAIDLETFDPRPPGSWVA